MSIVATHIAGKVKVVTFMPYHVNGQYIMEGITGAAMYSLGGEVQHSIPNLPQAYSLKHIHV